jgi:4'-phosphopantetheinyl transferase
MNDVNWPNTCRWPAYCGNLAIDASEVHLWCASLDQPEDVLDRFRGTLSADEHVRAERFRLGNLRNHFVAARGMMRDVLSRYLDERPEKLAFDYAAHGKPHLAAAWRKTELEFNLAHSHGVALLAVTRGEAIGVDIEQIRPMPNAGQLMERFFATEEIAQWQGLPDNVRSKAFFQGWTRKEAWLKAVGSGLSFPLDRFCISLDPAMPARVLSVDGDEEEAARWWLDSFEPQESYVAALAMRSAQRTVRCWSYQPEA